MESADTTSPLYFLANSMAKAVLPEAVGPTIAISFFLGCSGVSVGALSVGAADNSGSTAGTAFGTKYG